MSPLEELIRVEIGRNGPIPFRRFMELALYHPGCGYYRTQRDPFGVEGDFYTNAQLQPVFGRLLAQQIDRWRQQMGSLQDFSVLDLGAGRGETAEVIRACLPDITCIGVDLAGASLPPRFCGVVVCNEFFDALPVHSVERRGAGLIEHYVGVSGDGFQWMEGELSEPAIGDYIEQYAPGLAEGQKIEVNLGAVEHLRKLAAALERGFLLTIDYGYTAEQIAGGRRFPRGSLMSYERHLAGEDVLSAPGDRDITAHVNFTALEQRARDLGFLCEPLKTQMRFFMEIGEKDNFEAALAAGASGTVKKSGADPSLTAAARKGALEAGLAGGAAAESSLRLRMQLKALLFGMGETFQVLVMQKKSDKG